MIFYCYCPIKRWVRRDCGRWASFTVCWFCVKRPITFARRLREAAFDYRTTLKRCRYKLGPVFHLAPLVRRDRHFRETRRGRLVNTADGDDAMSAYARDHQLFYYNQTSLNRNGLRCILMNVTSSSRLLCFAAVVASKMSNTNCLCDFPKDAGGAHWLEEDLDQSQFHAVHCLFFSDLPWYIYLSIANSCFDISDNCIG